ncbi:putative Trichohyalin [Neospora caninum Liverpool]|uniref:Putative Trichohyalin n=1 Tax=Neospora caninum (strain Liverpool) TaxID=572307 RepID=F0VE43_NEOCL|nr:putative Trichohyalin [Neospora caninum Liverpool]CBZ51986.1 putative Trichohyalin [Neospora caninum Liverpool]|eukprot:XP_003882019.1 putative Trichohyalin [Neospora caninum Liverpool]
MADGKNIEKITAERLESQRKLAEILQDERRSTEERLKAATDAFNALQSQLTRALQQADEERQALREEVSKQTEEATRAAGLISQLETDLELTRRSLLQQTALTAAAAAAQAIAATEGEESEKQKKLEDDIQRLEEANASLEKAVAEERKKLEEERKTWKQQEDEREKTHQEAVEKAVAEERKRLEEERETWRKQEDEREKAHQEAVEKAAAEERKKLEEERETWRKQEDEREKAHQEAVEKAVAEERKKLEEERKTWKQQEDEREKAHQEAVEKAVAEERKKLEEERKTWKQQEDEREKAHQEAVEKAVAEERKKLEEERKTWKQQEDEREKAHQEAVEKAVAEERKKLEEERETWRKQEDEREKTHQEAVEKAVAEERKRLEEERETWKKQEEEREKETQKAVEKAVAEERKKLEEERETWKKQEEEREKETQKAVEKAVAEERKRLEEERKEREEEDGKRKEQERVERTEVLKRTEEETARAKQQVEELEKRMCEQEEKNRRLETVLREKEEKEEAFKQQTAEEKQALVKEIERLTDQAAEAAGYKDVAEKLRKANQENGDLELRLEALVDEKEAAVREVTAAMEKAQDEETEIVMFSQSGEFSDEEDEGLQPSSVIRRKLRRIEKLEGEVKTKEAAVHDLEEKVNTLLASQSAATVNLAAKEEELAAEQKRNEQLQRDLDAHRKEEEEKKKSVEALEKENCALQERNLALAQQLADEGTKAADAEAKLHAAEEALKAAREEASISAESASAFADRQELLEKTGRLTMDLAEKTEEVAQLQQKLRRLEKLPQTAETLSVPPTNATGDALVDENARLRRDIATKDGQLAELEQKLSEAEQEVKLRARSRAGSEWKVVTLVQTNADLVTKLAKAEEDLAAERRAGTQQKEERERMAQQQKDQEEKIHDLVATNAQLVDDLAAKDAAASEATRQLVLATEKLKNLEARQVKAGEQASKINELKTSNETLSEKVQEQEAAIRALHEEAETRRREAEKAAADLEAKNRDIAEINATHEKAVDTLTKKEAEMERAAQHAREVEASLRESLSAAQARLEETEKKIVEIESHYRDARAAETQAKDAALASLRSELASLKAQLAGAQKKQNAAHAEADEKVQQLLAANSGLVTELAEKEAHLADVKHQLGKLEAKAARCSEAVSPESSADEAMARLLITNSELMNRLAEKEEESTHAAQLLATLKSENEMLRCRIEDRERQEREDAREDERGKNLHSERESENVTALREHLEEARVLLALEKEKRVQQNLKLKRQLASVEEARKKLEEERDEALAAWETHQCSTSPAPSGRRRSPERSQTPSERENVPETGASGDAGPGVPRLARFKREVERLREAGADISPLEERFLLRKMERHPTEAEATLAIRRAEVEMHEKVAAGRGGKHPGSWWPNDGTSVQAKPPGTRLAALKDRENDRVELTAAEMAFFGGDGPSVLSVLEHSTPPESYLALPFAAPPHAHLQSSSSRPRLVSPLSPFAGSAAASPHPSDFLTSVSLYRPELWREASAACLTFSEPQPFELSPSRLPPLRQTPEEAMRNPFPLIHTLATVYKGHPRPSRCTANRNSSSSTSASRVNSPASLQPFFAPLPLSRPFAARRAKRGDCVRNGPIAVASPHGNAERENGNKHRENGGETERERARRPLAESPTETPFAAEKGEGNGEQRYGQDRDEEDQGFHTNSLDSDSPGSGRQETPEGKGKKRRGFQRLFPHRDSEKKPKGRGLGGRVAGIISVSRTNSSGRDWKR